jgi:hypothetical protein
MKTSEVNNDIIGRRCKCIFTGLMVTGTIEDVKVSKYTAEVKVRFDEPCNWGNDWYEYTWSFARLHDENGSLKHLEIIDDTYYAIKVTFSQTIREINKMFTSDYSKWQIVNLKEWVDSYETSRFTQIDECCAIITSETNMEYLKNWLLERMIVKEIEIISK